MEPRPLTAIDREAQILALWRGRPLDRRSLEDVAPFYEWLVDYAPWLLPADAALFDYVHAVVEPHTISPDQLRDQVRKDRRPRSPAHGRQRRPMTTSTLIDWNRYA
jgi:hypothetical protein